MSGWVLLDSVIEDWDGDGVNDVALVAEHEDGENVDERLEKVRQDSSGWRRLTVLLADRNGKLRVIGVSDDAINCASCGGVKGSWSVSSRRGSLFVYNMSGSSMFTERTTQFQYDSSTGRMRLIGIETVNHNGLTGATVNESTNLPSGKREITVHRFRKRHDVIVSHRTESIRDAKWYLEDIGKQGPNNPLDWTSEEASQLWRDR